MVRFFRAHATQVVALHAPEIFHRVAMKNVRAIQRKFVAQTSNKIDLILFCCRVLQHIFVLHVMFLDIEQCSHPLQQILLA